MAKNNRFSALTALMKTEAEKSSVITSQEFKAVDSVINNEEIEHLNDEFTHEVIEHSNDEFTHEVINKSNNLSKKEIKEEKKQEGGGVFNILEMKIEDIISDYGNHTSMPVCSSLHSLLKDLAHDSGNNIKSVLNGIILDWFSNNPDKIKQLEKRGTKNKTNLTKFLNK